MDRPHATAPGSPAPIRSRVASFDWTTVETDLEERGHARLPGLLSPSECRELVRLYPLDGHFRTTVDMGRHGFGEGEYRYFASPLPPLVRSLRTALYARLRRIANHWQDLLGDEMRYPARLATFLEECREAGQNRPTPLLLRYEAGGYNCLHQDLYGEKAFPLQIACLLSQPSAEFEGGEFLLTEQRPRMQSRGEAIVLKQGEAVIFANADRPVRGSRGIYRVKTRHGVSRVHAGERLTLGLIFHDAE
jgi:hypothetical protein